jgi:hypothetical protein
MRGRSGAREVKLEPRDELAQNAAKQFLVVLAHLRGFVDGIGPVAQKI